MNERKKLFDISSAGLHILAMALMLCDHAYITLMPADLQWMTAIGRLAFPIFAFLTVEGYFHTRDLKAYLKRMLIFALISEIPFNLMISGSPINPIHQNVLCTFLIGLVLIHLNERAKERGRKTWVRLLIGVGTVLLGFAAGYLLFVDYFGAGVLTVLVFYFLRKRKWWSLVLQIAALWVINTQLLGGLGTRVSLFKNEFFMSYQSLALLSLIPIWLYRGRKGHSSKAFKYFCYVFYPAHMLVLWLFVIILA